MILKKPDFSRFVTDSEWAFDYENRVNPELMTRLAHEAVPVLRWSNWQVMESRFGYAKSLLPINETTTNQHGTHQAALIALSADYTGGMALTTLLTGTPLTGLHPGDCADAASMWLVGLNMRYARPSTGHMEGTCHIPDDVISKIRNRYAKGKHVLVSLSIEFVSNGEIVATGEGRYFAQPTRQLLESSDNEMSLLAAQKLKASARMIAGTRALSEMKTRHDRAGQGIDEIAAGPHGILLARKMSGKLPQLGNFVAARTRAIDSILTSTNDWAQIVLLGAGLDMRPAKFANVLPNTRFFELDLPEMLTERKRVCESDNSICVPVDFTRQNIAQRLVASGFNPARKSFIIFEGCSMYFDEPTNRKILQSIRSMLGHKESAAWCDLVDKRIIDGTFKTSESLAFLRAMESLGERFVFGADAPEHWFKTLGISNVHRASALDYLQSEELSDATDEIYSNYHFCHFSR